MAYSRKQLVVLAGCRNSGQSRAMQILKLAHGKSVRTVQFWSSALPFVADLDDFSASLYGSFIQALLELKTGTVNKMVWDMSWLELTALANFQSMPSDVPGYKHLLTELQDFTSQGGSLTIAVLEGSSSNSQTDTATCYKDKAALFRQAHEDLAVLTELEYGVATCCSVLNAKVAAIGRLSNEAGLDLDKSYQNLLS